MKMIHELFIIKVTSVCKKDESVIDLCAADFAYPIVHDYEVGLCESIQTDPWETTYRGLTLFFDAFLNGSQV